MGFNEKKRSQPKKNNCTRPYAFARIAKLTPLAVRVGFCQFGRECVWQHSYRDSGELYCCHLDITKQQNKGKSKTDERTDSHKSITLSEPLPCSHPSPLTFPHRSPIPANHISALQGTVLYVRLSIWDRITSIRGLYSSVPLLNPPPLHTLKVSFLSIIH